MADRFIPHSCFRLDDGTDIEMTGGEAEEVYNELWLADGTPGALSGAAKVLEAQRLPLVHRVFLDRNESSLITRLLAGARSHAT